MMDLPRVLVHKAPGVESKIRRIPRESLGNSPQHALKQTLREDSALERGNRTKVTLPWEVSRRGSGVRTKPGNLEEMFQREP